MTKFSLHETVHTALLFEVLAYEKTSLSPIAICRASSTLMVELWYGTVCLENNKKKILLTLSQTSPGFYVSAVEVF